MQSLHALRATQLLEKGWNNEEIIALVSVD
jgi:hypothetical protein